MNKFSVIMATAIVIVLGACNSGSSSFKSKPSMENEIDSVSYFIGTAIGKNLKSSGASEFDFQKLASGITDGFNEVELSMTEAEVQQFMNAYFQKIEMQSAEKNAGEGKKWLEGNKSKAGVIETPSGLQYKVITEGKGPKPTDTDNVTVHYVGKLLDGKVFDSSLERGQPATFGVTQVIPGWTEAIKMMPVGSKWELYIPAELGYGTRRDPGGQIPANSTLIFEVELLDIAAPEKK